MREGGGERRISNFLPHSSISFHSLNVLISERERKERIVEERERVKWVQCLFKKNALCFNYLS